MAPKVSEEADCPIIVSVSDVLLPPLIGAIDWPLMPLTSEPPLELALAVALPLLPVAVAVASVV
jgi:hypothetical protein